MYKILIADDEEIIGTCLKKMIDWKSINAEVIGVALDGEEALKMFREKLPDIALPGIICFIISIKMEKILNDMEKKMVKE